MDGAEGYDPVQRAELVRRLVTRAEGDRELRLYFRFRADRWYGGIATGDVIGCDLSCAFCWSWRFRDNPRLGIMLSPEAAASNLYSVARSRGFTQARLSGGEPTISRRHLLRVAELLGHRGITFIVETNGLLIGADKTYARDLAGLDNVVVRVSFKGVTAEEFHRLTGAKADAFELQFRALENLLEAGLEPGRRFYAAAMIGFSREEDVERFVERLKGIDPALADVDWEYVFLYPHVVEALQRRGLRPTRAVEPSKIPRSMI